MKSIAKSKRFSLLKEDNKAELKIMCGIAGIIHFNQKPIDKQLIKLMTNEIAHRGPDGEGQWLNGNKNVGLGHRRLSIIDLSTAASQPMQYAGGRYTITYNGEIYNYPELKDHLQKKGYYFQSTSDTEVLLAMYDYLKEDCLAMVDGMFAFAIWDEKEQELFCARDRFGEKPFFYYMDEERFVFASEIKALWKAGIEKKIEPKMVYEFLMYNTLRNPNAPDQTFYRDIFDLEQAHYMRIGVNEEKNVVKKKYWQLNPHFNNEQLSFKTACEQFHELFSTSVNRRLRSDVSVGSSLSGGLDSSSIVALVQNLKNKPRHFQTFSARFKNFEKDEGQYIKLVTDQYKLKSNEVIPTDESIENNFNKLVHHQDEPFGSMSIEAQFEVFGIAKNSGTKVLLDGQGADEYLAGYKRLQATYYYQLANSDKATYHNEQNAYFKLYGQKFKKRSFAEKLKRRNKTLFDFIDNQRRKIMPLNHSYFLGIHPDLVQQNRLNNNPISGHRELKEHLFEATFQSGLVNLLRYADRNAMAHSVEVRLPFLYHELVEFVFSLPDSFLIHDAWSKYILRKSIEKYLPSEVVWRKEKVGFATPQNRLLKSNFFSDKKSKAIDKLKSEGIINKVNPDLDWQYIMLSEYTA